MRVRSSMWIRELLSLVLVLVVLGNVLMPAISAMGTTNEVANEVLLKRVVVASIDGKGKLLLNITWVNQTIVFGTCSGNCSCVCSGSGMCPIMPYSVDINVIYNVSVKGESLELLKITVYNESYSYSSYILIYNVRHKQYNLSVVTEIIPINNTNLFITTVNIDPRDDKAQPIADIVFLVNKTTLANHYRLISNVLNEIRKQDSNTNWIWNKVRIELNNLAKKIERNLAEYNVEGIGITTVMDGTVCIFPVSGMPPIIIYIITFECLDPRAPDWVLVMSCCVSLYSIVAECTYACISSGGLGCIVCISIGAMQVGTALAGCYGNCPAMNVCLKALWIFGWITIACTRLW